MVTRFSFVKYGEGLSTVFCKLLKPNVNFGVCANDVDDTGIILKSNPRGLGCIFKATLDTLAGYTGKKVENISKCFLKRVFTLPKFWIYQSLKDS